MTLRSTTSPTTPEKIEPLTDALAEWLCDKYSIAAERFATRDHGGKRPWRQDALDLTKLLAALRPPAAGEDVRDTIAEIIEPLVDFSAVYGDDLGYSRDAVKRLSARMRATAILSHLQSVGYARVPERADIAQWFDKNVVQPGHNKRERFARSASDYADSLLAALKERG